MMMGRLRRCCRRVGLFAIGCEGGVVMGVLGVLRFGVGVKVSN